jgi:hypothetical protein
LVAEIPPKVLGLVNDFWYKWVADVGITGADKGEGGKYLLLPAWIQGRHPVGVSRRAAEYLRQLARISRLRGGRFNPTRS